jgi:hypothetical protein
VLGFEFEVLNLLWVDEDVLAFGVLGECLSVIFAAGEISRRSTAL